MVKAVLFDCDGILLDSMDLWHNLEAHLASRANITLNSKQMDMLNRNTLRQTVEYFYTKYRLENRFEALYAYAYNYLLKQYQNSVTARKGILPVLKKLKNKIYASILPLQALKISFRQVSRKTICRRISKDAFLRKTSINQNRILTFIVISRHRFMLHRISSVSLMIPHTP